MSDLKFKTRGMVSPSGKPKVYLCCHPKDLKKYLKPISEEILAKSNCAVWYVENPKAVRDEEFIGDLKQMQLFVVPVTANFLKTENVALDVEFKVAKENNIPILPLMQSGGLTELFNEKCGNLQFLDKFNEDTTAIEYDKKLEDYLSSVLIGDELAEKIRSAFDAYVFLSYRKIDRKYARDLMGLIHKNDFCRDIAIWYDEFLIPGEDFNSSIKDALQKSDMFVMTVTPNLINGDNYILTTEYPMAKSENKPILPVEVVPTDREVLADKFSEIPLCVDGNNEAEFSDAMLKKLKELAVTRNDNSPEHNFFIGLAYLGGVDVEVDYKKALELITFAAENGVVEALSKLVEMYSNGIGVPYSIGKALEWQEKKVELLQEKYADTDKHEEFEELFWSINQCGDIYYRDFIDFEKAREKYSLAAAVTKSFAKKNGKNSFDYSYYISVTYDHIGHMLINLEKVDEAAVYVEKAGKHFKERARKNPTIGNVHDMMLNVIFMMDIYTQQGEYEKCKVYCKVFAFGFEKISDEDDYYMLRHDLATIYLKLAEVYAKEGDSKQQLEALEKSFELYDRINEEVKTNKSRTDLLIVCALLKNICEENNYRGKAKRYMLKMVEISADADNKMGSVETKLSLFASCVVLAEFLEDEDPEKAMKYYEKAVKAFSKVSKCKEVEISEVFAKYVNSLFSLGRYALAKKDYKKAKEYHLELVRYEEQYVREEDEGEVLRVFGVHYDLLGEIYEVENNQIKAQEVYEKALKWLTLACEKTDDVQAKIDLAICYRKNAWIFERRGKTEESAEMFEKSGAVQEQVCELKKSYKQKGALAVNYAELGRIYEKLGDMDKAMENLVKYAECLKELKEEYPEVPDSEMPSEQMLQIAKNLDELMPEGNLAWLKALVDKGDEDGV